MAEDLAASAAAAGDLPVPPGLCASCRHAIVRPTRRGTVYLRCAFPELPKYPDLPVLACVGHDPGSPS